MTPRTADMIDRDVAAVALAVQREHAWYSRSGADTEAVQRALTDAGHPPTDARRWWRSCPSSGTPQCNLTGTLRSVHGYMTTVGPARADCRYCRGAGYCTSLTPSTPGDLVSVLSMGAERVRWAEEVLAARVAADLGIELHRVAWQVCSEHDVKDWPPYRGLADQWVIPLDAGADGSVVLGVQWVSEAALRAAVAGHR